MSIKYMITPNQVSGAAEVKGDAGAFLGAKNLPSLDKHLA
jgi:hypothetical protein